MMLLLRPCASLPIVTVTGCMPNPPRRGGWEWHPGPPLQDLSAVVPGARAFCWGPSVLCCTGCILSAWFGVIVLVPFSSPSPLYRTFHVATAPFSTSSRCPRPLPSPVNVYIVLHFVSACLRHVRPAPPCPSSPAAGTRLHCPFATQPRRRGHLYRIFHDGLRLGGLGPT